MSIRQVIALLGGLLIVAGLTISCGAPPQELTMEVPTPQTVIVGKNVLVQVIFRNLPEEGSDFDMTWYGFGEQPQVTIRLLPPSGDRVRLQLRCESSNASILGGLAEPPMIFSPNGAELRPRAKEVSLGFSFETLSAGTTELLLTLTRPDGNAVSKRIDVTVTASD